MNFLFLAQLGNNMRYVRLIVIFAITLSWPFVGIQACSVVDNDIGFLSKFYHSGDHKRLIDHLGGIEEATSGERHLTL